MFIGHFAVGFAVKRVAPEVKLWQALLAAGLLDVIWPVLILAGVEQVIIEPGNTPMTPLNCPDRPHEKKRPARFRPRASSYDLSVNW